MKEECLIMKQITLNKTTINPNSQVYIIAEMSACHGGLLSNALKIVQAAKEAGADCIKTQTYTPDTLTLDCFSPEFMAGGKLWEDLGYNTYRLYQESYTPWEWQERIQREAESLGLDFFSTPFDVTAVDFLEELNVKFYKIASYELVDIALIEYIASKGKPIIISTGMATIEEISEAVEAIRSQGNNQIALLKCSSLYPANPADMNLITIPDLSSRFDVIAGLSDHTFGSLSAIIGTSLGAKIIEKHLCLDRNIKSHDAGFSMEPTEFKKMVQDVRETEKAIGVKPYTYTDSEIEGRKSRRSLYISADVKKGDTFTPDNIRSVRPGLGINTKYYNEILQKKAVCDALKGTPLQWDMVE